MKKPHGGIHFADSSRQLIVLFFAIAPLFVAANALSGQITPPTIAKVFGASTIAVNGTTTLTITIQNPNAALALTGVAFTDTLPAGLVFASPSGLAQTCGGVAVAATGPPAALSLSGGALAGAASCTVSVNVTAATAGVYVNTTANVTSTNGGSGNTATATLTVVAPPTIAKAFGVANLPPNGTTTLTVTVQNPNPAVALTSVNFTDTLPAGLVFASPSGLNQTCGGVAVAATGPPAVLSLSGGTIAGGASCTVGVTVTAATAGVYVNTTGNVTSANGGSGNTATATLTVLAPPTIAKSFAPATIVNGGNTTLTFTLANPAGNNVALTGVSFTDVLPAGLAVAAGSAPACGGTLTTSGTGTVTLSGASIAVNGTCTINVTVFGISVGSYTNVTGNVASTNGGTGNTASANLTVLLRPLIPTLSGWMLGVLGMLLAGASLLALRRREN